MLNQCYYCEQIFDTKEQLFEHVEVHSYIEVNREINERRLRVKLAKSDIKSKKGMKKKGKVNKSKAKTKEKRSQKKIATVRKRRQ